MDLLHEFLSSTSSDFDVVTITETSQRNNVFLKLMLPLKAMVTTSLFLSQKEEGFLSTLRTN